MASSGSGALSSEEVEKLRESRDEYKNVAESRLKELELLRAEHGKLKGELANAASATSGLVGGELVALVQGHILYKQGRAFDPCHHPPPPPPLSSCLSEMQKAKTRTTAQLQK